ncbi:hypothetical protein TOT_040000674 [Theileria orientalis strain Shintoku]|uniref:Uncharacterized protein n=1 Tax=Theileria orientalis strain Shintoku TaxID=869250 RepID=J7M4M7_THEOR|nr:hypothetical protein TOT_040000674 [Theileria orientalis strain Shintoku]BAM42305.1 hypothetical protein TOT_040000674 [Theileria orientalis strain Shintoku]|eukprot:XP_009692606.1 hypothetical protein TOT_040000674 [Theileria orientalis strain Shintoku]
MLDSLVHIRYKIYRSVIETDKSQEDVMEHKHGLPIKMSVGNKSQESLNSEEVINNYVKNAMRYTGNVNKATGKGGREIASEGKQVLETILESKEYIKVQRKGNILGILLKAVLILGLITLTVFVVTSVCLESNKRGEGN